MTEIQIKLTGELRPDWFIRLEGIVSEARSEGWNLRAPIVFEGYPYVWQGEPRMATWTFERAADTEEPQP